ncbi:LysM peptidoglycan-binding domain-containing protein [Lysinibacillus sp. 54212]|uniref:LysM peptidoglycan-binding domain-containing protein n=1 Tax=Lysinibacillus sp. 54212 TaxID=3119829 RepID=UPI002FCABC95
MTTLDFIGKSFINGYAVLVQNENVDLDVDIPSHKVEKGINVTDHVERQPKVVKLTGKLIRPTPSHLEAVVNEFYKWEKTGKLNTYEGRRIYKNMLMHGLQLKASVDMMNGYDFSCTLTELDIANPSYVAPTVSPQVKGVTSSGQKQNANKKTSEVYHTVKKGDTYWGLSKKYGSSIAQLQKWNKYEPTKIPIGVKLRVV